MNIKALKLKSFLQDDEDYISGKELIKRAGNAIVDYEELLKQQDEFPKEWRKYYLVFPKLLDGDRDRRVACFYWGEGSQEWVLVFLWDGLSFSRGDRFVVPRESLNLRKLSPEIWPLETLEINGRTYKLVE